VSAPPSWPAAAFPLVVEVLMRRAQAGIELCVLDAASGLPVRSAIDTVARFQGGERMAILVSATESDRGYLLASSEFLLDPRRLTVALSRAKRKMILVASRTIFEFFSPHEEVFLNSQLWKNLLLRTCTTRLWVGERDGLSITVWGGRTETQERVGEVLPASQ
jgi:AAA domain